jgi:hypothetical protein
MAAIQHINMTSAQVHEPKHISTSLTSQSGMVITPSSSTAGTSELRRLTAQDLDADNSSSFLTYWGFYEDSAYTSGSPLAVTASTRTQVTIDGLKAGTNLSQMPVGVDLWDTVTNKITPQNVGDLIVARISFKGDAGVAINAYVDIDLDIGGAVGVIFEETKLLVKNNAENKFVMDWPMYVDSTSLANGFTLNITPSDNTDFYDFGILLYTVHKGS